MAEKEGYTVRRGRREDMVGVQALCLEHGWNIAIEFLNLQFDCYPEGAFIVESADGDIISHCSSVCLDDSTGFIAYYITKGSYRGKGIGRKVFDLSMQALGNRNVGLNSAWNLQKAYRSAGFVVSTFTLTTYFSDMKDLLLSKNVTPSDPALKIVSIKDVDFEKLLDYDKKIHPMERLKVLKWLLDFASVGLVALVAGEVKGWGTLYKAIGSYRMMPLYSDTPTIAKALAVELLSRVAGDTDRKVEALVADTNEDAMKLCSDLGLTSGGSFLSKRMFTDHDIPLPTHLAYSILNYENVLI